MSTLTIIHIVGGSLALAAGFGALMFRKGGRVHMAAGTLFFLSMLEMAGTGSVMAALKPERGTAVIGILTCYLVATSWATVRRRDGKTGLFELAGLAVAIGIAATMYMLGMEGLRHPKGLVDSIPAPVHFVFGGIAALAALLDLNHILRRSVTAKQRIARHLWRMCAALLIAAFSFFIGQQKVMPEAIQGSPLLFIPPIAVLGAMIFWILRMRFGKMIKLPVARRRAGRQAPLPSYAQRSAIV